jgi:diguanylate cyclase (GGDEF)-like protein/PAS domain S-box-containing protein
VLRSVTQDMKVEPDRFFEALLEASSDAILITRVHDGLIVELSRSLAELTGCARDELIGRTTVALRLVQPGDRERVVGELQVNGTGSGYETRLRTKHGDWRWIDFSSQVVPAGGDEYVLTIARDVTERKTLEAELAALAEEDSLTGLANRRRFGRELDLRCAFADRYGFGGCLLLLDLDRFKSVNDELGHAAGDAVLVAVADVLRERLRKSDVLARLGGDEFAVVLTSASADEVQTIVADLAWAVRERARQAVDEGVEVGVSIGAANILPGVPAASVMHEADRRMYEDKLPASELRR